MTVVDASIKVGDDIEMAATGLIACNHCGIVALNTPAYGWRRYFETWVPEDADDPDSLDGAVTRYAHHCPAAVQINEWVAQGAYPPRLPDEAVVYQDVDVWLVEVLGPQEPDPRDA